MLGKILGHYEITAKLGAGGMGDVYQALDRRLGRRVAVKILREAGTDPAAAERFDREARTVASLSHPHVCTLFDVGTHDGVPYLVMEYLEGETLADRLRAGPLPVDEALRFGSQIADAVAAAHARGVIHRDLKPANIKLTSTGAKVLDFGLAKFCDGERSDIRPADAATGFATASHTIVGTVAYMSPEQARGEVLDRRTDCWSFGVVLYEMLTGRPLFSGPHSLSVLSAVLADRISLSALPAGVPAAVRDVMTQLLERNPSRRLGGLIEVAAALGGATVSRPAVAPRPTATTGGAAGRVLGSIVVLPFVNRSPEAENEYFSDGLTEEVIADLSRISALRVISRTTAMRLKDTRMDLAEIAGQLGVRYALEGSVRKAGDDLRITVQLIDIATDSTLWSDKYSGRLDDIFAIQERVARAIAGALRLKLNDTEDRGLSPSATRSAFAYDTYLRARRDALSFMPERLARAQAELQHALAVTGDDPLLCAGLGLVHWQYINGGISGDRQHLREAERYAQRVIALDPASAKGPQLLGLIAAQSGDNVGWARHLRRAVDLDPHDPDSLIWLAFAWTWGGIPHLARPLYDHLLSIDPLFDYLHWGLGFDAYLAGDYALAERHFEKGRQLSPDHPGGVMVLAQTFAAAGQIDRMARYVDEHAPDPSVHPLHALTHIFKFALLGEVRAADALTSSELESKLWSDFQYTLMMAQAQAALRRNDEALRWLQRSTDRGCVHYPFLAERDPLLSNLRGDPAFAALMDRVRRAWETFEARVASAEWP